MERQTHQSVRPLTQFAFTANHKTAFAARICIVFARLEICYGPWAIRPPLSKDVFESFRRQRCVELSWAAGFVALKNTWRSSNYAKNEVREQLYLRRNFVYEGVKMDWGL
jgi:hypothetical protein